MSIRHFDRVFKPRSIAVIGASSRSRSLGNIVFKNLLQSDFSGVLTPVNLHHKQIEGVSAVPSVADMPEVPELAMICTPAKTVPDLLQALSRAGCQAAVILSDGFRVRGDKNVLQDEVQALARSQGIRILGPNSLGFISPRTGLNASAAHLSKVAPGKLAFVSQSSALCSAILDWGHANKVGFSHVVSLGDSVDIDVADVLDYLVNDYQTRNILLYVESFGHARKFMSAARAASRNKTVLIIKAGREANVQAAGSLTLDSEQVANAAITRAGMLRVYSLSELFDATETLTWSKPINGQRLAILSNGGGPAVMATDTLVDRGGRLAALEPETIARLDQLIPRTGRHQNPVDITGVATAKHYVRACEALLEDAGVDTVLVLHVPMAGISSTDIALALSDTIKHAKKPVLTCWMGGDSIYEARDVFHRHSIPFYDTPFKAVRAFLHRVAYRRTQKVLMETPPSNKQRITPDEKKAHQVIQQALDAGRDQLDEEASHRVLAAFGLPVVPTRCVPTVEAGCEAARVMTYPVAVKANIEGFDSRTGVGGIALNVEGEKGLKQAFESIEQRVVAQAPDAVISSYTVQKMVRRPDALELVMGVRQDPAFGPVILFGQGGLAADVATDIAVALPPLNLKLARDLMRQTRMYRILRGDSQHPAVNLEALDQVLFNLSKLVVGLPRVTALDINPLVVDDAGAVVVGARIWVQDTAKTGEERLAIRPYPADLEERITLPNGRSVLLRPIRPDDEPMHQAFFNRLDPEDIYLRFFRVVRALNHEDMAHFTQIDYDREMAIIAVGETDEGEPEILGVVRVVNSADNQDAEFAIIIRRDQKGQQLGRTLMEKVIRYCRESGKKRVIGETLYGNSKMVKLARRLGFKVTTNLTDRCYFMELSLRDD